MVLDNEKISVQKLYNAANQNNSFINSYSHHSSHRFPSFFNISHRSLHHFPAFLTSIPCIPHIIFHHYLIFPIISHHSLILPNIHQTISHHSSNHFQSFFKIFNHSHHSFIFSIVPCT